MIASTNSARTSDFPIPIPDRLPIRIDPCPIVEAILEIRFVTSESWATLPGLLFARIRDRYPEQKNLPLAQIPEEMRRREPTFTYQPLIQFLGRGDFLIQFGPRVVSLVAKSKEYPGWSALETEITSLISELQQTGFVSEGERLGVRYINFFNFDVFEKLQLEVCATEKTLAGGELSVTSVLSRPPFTSRLLVANSAIVGTGDEARRGSILDVDVWLGPNDFDLFENGLAKFNEAHQFEKQIFFGLLKPNFLATLNPVYE
jgi:uncharacterized protein (TIGR04255 family)